MERIIRKPLQSLHDFKTRTSRPPLQPLGASSSAGYNNNQAQQFASGAGALVGHQDADTIKHLASTVGDFNFRSVASCHHIIILYLIFSGRWPGVTCTSWCWIGSRSSAWQSTFTAQTPQSRCREVETQNRYSKKFLPFSFLWLIFYLQTTISKCNLEHFKTLLEQEKAKVSNALSGSVKEGRSGCGNVTGAGDDSSGAGNSALRQMLLDVAREAKEKLNGWLWTFNSCIMFCCMSIIIFTIYDCSEWINC